MKWLMENWQEVVQLTAVHLTLAVAAIVAATLVAVPLGRLASEQPRLGGGLLTAFRRRRSRHLVDPGLPDP